MKAATTHAAIFLCVLLDGTDTAHHSVVLASQDDRLPKKA